MREREIGEVRGLMTISSSDAGIIRVQSHDNNHAIWRSAYMWCLIPLERSTVEPLYSSHPWGTKYWLL